MFFPCKKMRLKKGWQSWILDSAVSEAVVVVSTHSAEQRSLVMVELKCAVL